MRFSFKRFFVILLFAAMCSMTILGNNVPISQDSMDYNESGDCQITIKGEEQCVKAKNEKCSITKGGMRLTCPEMRNK